MSNLFALMHNGNFVDIMLLEKGHYAASLPHLSSSGDMESFVEIYRKMGFPEQALKNLSECTLEPVSIYRENKKGVNTLYKA